ncbi:MAG: hypothetical protein ABIY55_35870 [Kofleriaceae bacterium]
MVEAVTKVVNPALEERDCAGNLHIGIDIRTVVVTKIGVLYADEVTAYGDAVSAVAKISNASDNNVIVSERSINSFPRAAVAR